MRDIPVFTTEYGIASLMLGQIPYRGCAYIRLQSTGQPHLLLKECVSFCKACGAEQFYATGHPALEEFPLYTAVVNMGISLDALPPTDAALFPLLPENAKKWQQIYNDSMKNVPLAAYLNDRDLEQLLRSGGGYFVHQAGQLLGIGKALDGVLHAVASLIPGSGKDAVSALCSSLTTDTVVLEVASENKRAMALYQRMGFLLTGEKERWYQV